MFPNPLNPCRSAILLLAICTSLGTSLAACRISAEPEDEFAAVFAHEEYMELAQSIDLSINSGDPSYYDQAIEMQAFYRRIVGGESRSGLDYMGFVNIVPPGLGLGEAICGQIEGGGSYKPLMVHSVDGRARLLVRMLSAKGELNYHDLILGGTPGLRPKIVDVYNYATGELFSTTIRRGAYRPGSGPFARLARLARGEESGTAPYVAADSLRRLHARGESDRALEYYRELPERLKKEKLVLHARLQVAREHGGDEYRRAMLDYQRFHPDDPSLNLVLIDHYYEQKQYDRLFAAIDRLDSSVDRDPYLAYMRGVIHREAGDTASAKKWARRAIAGDKTMAFPYWLLMECALLEQDHAGVMNLLDGLHEHCNVNIDELGIDQHPRFTEFAASGVWVGRGKRQRAYR